jgi:hypothetical protein
MFQVVGTMNIDAESLMLTTLAKSLAGLGYEVEVSCSAVMCTDCLFHKSPVVAYFELQ